MIFMMIKKITLIELFTKLIFYVINKEQHGGYKHSFPPLH